MLSDDSNHVLNCVPTGWGKTLPMLVTALLMPPGKIVSDCGNKCYNQNRSTTSIIVPLTTIGNQLKDLCDKHGVTAVLSSEVWIRVPSKNDVSLLDKNTLCINNGE